MYREGSFDEELVLEANVPSAVPEGIWTWIAEAPGYVSKNTGRLQIGPRTSAKRLLWSVLPACELRFSGGDWTGATRLDIVSLDHGATYPIRPTKRETAQIPEGRFLAYTVSPRGLLAISSMQSCLAFESIPLARPQPPGPDRQDLMVHLQPEPEEEAAPGDLGLVLGIEDSGAGMLKPSAALFHRQRSTFFFLGVPAQRSFLLATHPLLLSEKLKLAPQPGTAYEMTIPMQGRVTLEALVDYQPQRPHRKATVGISRCGDRPLNLMAIDLGNCLPVGESQTLSIGPHHYRFGNLDRGQTVVWAEIDGERIFGLEDQLAPFIEGAPETLHGRPQVLEEHHIFGELTLEDKPVAGRLELLAMGSFAPLRNWPTDDGLFFHIFYFGQSNAYQGRPPEAGGKPNNGPRGLPAWGVLRACAQDGPCRTFHHRSTFSGSGRFDIELDAPSRVQTTVESSTTGDPIEGAWVVLNPSDGLSPVTRFNNGVLGEASSSHGREEEGSAEGMIIATDMEGRSLHVGLRPGDYNLRATAPSFHSSEKRLMIPPESSQTLVVRLDPIDELVGPAILLASGEPAAGAILLSFREDGGPDFACVGQVDPLGGVRLSDACLRQERPWLVFHPETWLEVVSPRDLQPGSTVELDERDGPGLHIQLVGGDGAPRPNTRAVLRFSEFELGPDHLIQAARSGLWTSAVSDLQGNLSFPFLDPRQPLPEASVGGISFTLIPAPGSTGIVVELP